MEGNCKKNCTECEMYEQDYTCRRLAEWLGLELAEDCVSFKRLEGAPIFERMLEWWR
jgi:hypothetical protein